MDKSYTELHFSNENMKEYILTLEENIADIEERYSDLLENYYELKDKYSIVSECLRFMRKNSEELWRVLEENGLAEELEDNIEAEEESQYLN